MAVNNNVSSTKWIFQVNSTSFPTLFAMAMDFLPIQATAVPCERVFSSSAETDTKRRNRISPLLMEALQMLKFTLKKNRLDFTADWITQEKDLRVDDPDDDLLRTVLDGNSQDALDRILTSISNSEM